MLKKSVGQFDAPPCQKGLRGEGGQRALSKVVLCKKVCFGVPEELLCVKIIYILHVSKHELQYHIPTQALSEKGPVSGFVGHTPLPSLESRINRNH